jgi:argininosuccinate lyase
VKHTHEGSIGNLSNEHIAARMKRVLDTFPFAQVDEALVKLAGKA